MFSDTILDIAPYSFNSIPFGAWIQLGGQSYTCSNSTYSSPLTYADKVSTWHMQSVTYDRGRDEIRFYVDGVFQGNGTNNNGKGTASSYENSGTQFG